MVEKRNCWFECCCPVCQVPRKKEIQTVNRYSVVESILCVRSGIGNDHCLKVPEQLVGMKRWRQRPDNANHQGGVIQARLETSKETFCFGPKSIISPLFELSQVSDWVTMFVCRFRD